MRPVAIIEHDAVFASELRAAVESAGFATDCFADAAIALDGVRRQEFSLAIVDLAIPDVNAFDLCSEASRIVPIIAVTDGCREDVCVRAFESGADDCLARPFPPRELGARVRNVLRRAGVDGDVAGELDLAVSAMRVHVGGETRGLSRGEAEILALFVAANGAPLTVATLLQRLPAEHRVKSGTVESRIKSLRRKLGPGKLVSRGKFGYQLTGG